MGIKWVVVVRGCIDLDDCFFCLPCTDKMKENYIYDDRCRDEDLDNCLDIINLFHIMCGAKKYVLYFHYFSKIFLRFSCFHNVS